MTFAESIQKFKLLRKSAHIVLVSSLEKAIWNWMDTYPQVSLAKQELALTLGKNNVIPYLLIRLCLVTHIYQNLHDGNRAICDSSKIDKLDYWLTNLLNLFKSM